MFSCESHSIFVEPDERWSIAVAMMKEGRWAGATGTFEVEGSEAFARYFYL